MTLAPGTPPSLNTDQLFQCEFGFVLQKGRMYSAAGGFQQPTRFAWLAMSPSRCAHREKLHAKIHKFNRYNVLGEFPRRALRPTGERATPF